MKKLTPGTEIDGFIIDDCIHAGGMAHLQRALCAAQGRITGLSDGDENPAHDSR